MYIHRKFFSSWLKLVAHNCFVWKKSWMTAKKHLAITSLWESAQILLCRTCFVELLRSCSKLWKSFLLNDDHYKSKDFFWHQSFIVRKQEAKNKRSRLDQLSSVPVQFMGNGNSNYVNSSLFSFKEAKMLHTWLERFYNSVTDTERISSFELDSVLVIL